MRDVIGVQGVIGATQAMLEGMMLGEYQRRLDAALALVRRCVPAAIAELNPLLSKYGVSEAAGEHQRPAHKLPPAL